MTKVIDSTKLDTRQADTSETTSLREKSVDDLMARILYGSEKFVQYSNSRLTLDRVDLVEDYIKGNLQLGIVFCADAHGEEFHAIIKRLLTDFVDEEGAGNIVGGNGPASLVSTKPGEMAVFLTIVHVTKESEILVPSAVWLYRADDVGKVWVDFDYSSLLKFGVKRFAVLCDREYEPIFSDLKSLKLPDRIDDVIERGANILNDPPRISFEFLGDGGLPLESRCFAQGLRIGINSEGVSIGHEHLLDGSVKLCDILLGPLN
jgi:hypothetical protein